MADPILLDKAVYWINLAYIAGVSLTIITSLMLVYFSYKRSAALDAQLKGIRFDSDKQIAAANERAAKLSEAAAKAQSQMTSMAVTQEQLHKQNLELATELEKEKLARLEAEQRAASLPQLQPNGRRSLTPEQEQKLVSSLNGYEGATVTLIELGDAEAGSLARQITAAMQKAQLNVVVSKFGALVPAQVGVVCTHGPNDSAASELIKNLRSFNLTVYDRAGAPGQFEVLVGLNPKP